MVKSFDEFLNEKLERGYWHGEEAWILSGSKKDGYTILVDGCDEEEAKKVKKLVDADKPLGGYEDLVKYVEYDEWEEQQ